MMMMQKMQQEQAKNRMSIPPGGQLPPRGMVNPGDVHRMPVSQQGGMPAMINLQGNVGVPPSPDKPRGMPLGVNAQVRTCFENLCDVYFQTFTLLTLTLYVLFPVQLAGGPRRMSHPDVGPASQGSETEEAPGGGHTMQGRPGVPELVMQSGNGAQQMMVNPASNAHMMKQGPLPPSMPQHPGASPQQQLPSQAQQGGPMPGIHFPNVPTTSQSSRPKTPTGQAPGHTITP